MINNQTTRHALFHRAGEKIRLGAPQMPDEDDRWTEFEEKLLSETGGGRHSLRRWKHFAK